MLSSCSDVFQVTIVGCILMMTSRVNFKKFACLGLAVIILIVVYHLWLHQGEAATAMLGLNSYPSGTRLTC